MHLLILGSSILTLLCLFSQENIRYHQVDTGEISKNCCPARACNDMPSFHKGKTLVLTKHHFGDLP